MDNRRILRGAVAVIAALLTACASKPVPPTPTGAQEPTDFPNAYYLGLAKRGQPVFRVDPGRSLVIIEVRRAGSLAQLGHDHVVASHATTGFIAPEQGRADLYVALDTLVVDESSLREAAGLETHPSAADIAATRRNMLEKVLESDRYPFVRLAVTGAVVGPGEKRVPVAVTLHGTTRSIDASVEFQGGTGEALVTGSFAIDQSEFGIVPFSLLGGAIAVRDRVDVTFRLSADQLR